MRLGGFILATFSASCLAQPGPWSIRESASAVTVQTGVAGSATFVLENGVVNRIDLDVRGQKHAVSLECAGGLNQVDFQSVELAIGGAEPAGLPSSFALFFDLGDERFGASPRVQLSISEGRVNDMLVRTEQSSISSFWDNLCETLPPDSVCAADAPPPTVPDHAVLVEELRGFPAPMSRNQTIERRRYEVYEQLLVHGSEAVPSLVDGLRDSDVNLRRNAALALHALGGGWWPFECGTQRVDISVALPTLVKALSDPDSGVRSWSAQAIGGMQAAGAPAVPELIELLMSGDEGDKNGATIALRQIGPAARDALPALREALTDPSSFVRRFAQMAIDSIEG
jgi:hypothetical protein